MGYLFTSESVSEGHPDKVADQISDAVLDKLLAYDPSSKVACETLVTTGQVVLAGEVKTKAYVDMPLIAREVIKKIGYTKGEYMFESNSCGVLSAIHEQSPDINRGVERQDPMEQGAGDQGMMFGYATNETENYMPLSLDLAHRILQVLADVRRIREVRRHLQKRWMQRYSRKHPHRQGCRRQQIKSPQCRTFLQRRIRRIRICPRKKMQSREHS